MKKQIRRSVFETNSSSIHSIAIKRGSYEEGVNNFKKWLANPTLVFDLKEFGWEAKKYKSTACKASYLWTLACSDTLKDAIKRRRFIEETLKEKGISCRFQPVAEKKYEDGYECCVTEDDSWFGIDHSECLEEFKNKVFKDKELLLEFLFGDTYILTYNDNDEYGDWLASVEENEKEREHWIKGN